VLKHNVKRFVPLRRNSVEQGGHHVGKSLAHLVEIVGGVLRGPGKSGSWESSQAGLLAWLSLLACLVRLAEDRENVRTRAPTHDKVWKQNLTASGNGRAPFIRAIDIAAVTSQVLTDLTPQYCDYRAVRPALLNYNDPLLISGNET
jgi:hypothetical protein